MWNVPSKKRLDKIPRLYETDGKEKMVYLHFFLLESDWYIVEFDGVDTFFGFACLNGDEENAEWGYVSFSELKKLSIAGFEVDCEHERFFPVQSANKIDLITRCSKIKV